MTTELYDILKKYEVKIISAVILQDSLKRIKNNSKINFEAAQRLETLKFVIERFNIHVHRKQKSGFVIFDSLDNKIMNQMQKTFFNDVTKLFEHLYPTLIFLKDEYSNILQVSDLIASSLNSALYNSIKNENMIIVDELPNFNSYLKIYWDLFEFNPINKSVQGWGIKLWY